MRSVDYIVANNKLLANAAILVLGLIVISLLGAALVPGLSIQTSVLEHVAAISLGGVIVGGLILMISCTYIVLTHRKELQDWGLFLALTWLLPYFGVSIYLGGSALFKLRANKTIQGD